MAGTRLVYGDGWEDLKDCFSGTLGFNRGQGGSSTRSSRQRVYGGDHYVHPHHLGKLALINTYVGKYRILLNSPEIATEIQSIKFNFPYHNLVLKLFEVQLIVRQQQIRMVIVCLVTKQF